MSKEHKKRSWIWYAGLITGLLFFAAVALLCVRSAAERPHVFLIRIVIILLTAVFYTVHYFADLQLMYEKIYKYRWAIGFVLFAVCVLNKFHLSSMTMFNQYIQPGEGSEFISPILGVARAIRSDEWLVGVPKMMTAAFTNFGEYNGIVRAVKTTNMIATGYYLDYSILARPVNWGYYLFGAEYGISFAWCYRMIFGFLINFELCMILTKQKKLLSLFGACLLWFSMFTTWWSLVSYMFTAPAIIVLFYYFIKEPVRWKRLLFGAALAIAGAAYISGLYPAWQVPMGWIMVGLMAWTLIDNKEWLKWTWPDWLIFAVDIAFMASIVLRFLYVDMGYMDAITKTVYPGSRVSYGGYALNKLEGYYSSYISTFGGYPNPCEMAVIFGVYPLAIVTGILALIKNRFKNSLLWCLIVPVSVLGIYCTIEMPHLLAKLLMLTYSTPIRTADFFGVGLAYILIVSISVLIDTGGIPVWLSAVICGLCSIPAIRNAWMNNSGLKVYAIAAMIIASLILETIVVSGKKNRLTKITMIAGSIIFAIDGLAVNPLTVSLDAITTKPVAQEIKKILAENEDTRWAGVGDIVSGNYLIACGAPCINSVNYIPNMELWEKIDPKGEYDKVYNRYAHFVFLLSETDETTFTLIQDDLMQVKVNESDFKKMDLDYLFTYTPLTGKWADKLELLYNHNGACIYKVKDF